MTALSLLVSMYLQSVYAASSEEIEIFLSPVASRSRVREAVRGLAATRQIHALSMDAQTYYFLENGLPEFAELATAPARRGGAAPDRCATSGETHAPRKHPGNGSPRCKAARCFRIGSLFRRRSPRRGPRPQPPGQRRQLLARRTGEGREIAGQTGRRGPACSPKPAGYRAGARAGKKMKAPAARDEARPASGRGQPAPKRSARPAPCRTGHGAPLCTASLAQGAAVIHPAPERKPRSTRGSAGSKSTSAPTARPACRGDAPSGALAGVHDRLLAGMRAPAARGEPTGCRGCAARDAPERARPVLAGRDRRPRRSRPEGSGRGARDASRSPPGRRRMDDRPVRRRLTRRARTGAQWTSSAGRPAQRAQASQIRVPSPALVRQSQVRRVGDAVPATSRPGAQAGRPAATRPGALARIPVQGQIPGAL